MARGTIEHLEKKQTQAGKDYWRLKIAGEWYSVWKSNLVTGIAVGDEVEFSFAVKGDFRNIESMVKDGQPAPAQPAPQPSARPPHAAQEPDKQLSIVRQSCLRRAVELIIEEGLSVSLMEKADKAIGVAAYFTGWVMGAHEKPAPQEPEEQPGDLGPEPPPHGDEPPF